MKKVLLALVLLFFFVRPAFAADVVAHTTQGRNTLLTLKNAVKVGTATKSAGEGTLQTQTINNLKTRALNEIDKRITSLNELITKLNSVKKISADEKTQLTSQVYTEIASLQALKTKIQADTVLTTLRTDVQSIITSFRVYVFFMPKVTIIAVADKLSQIADNLSTISAKLQSRVNEAKAKGLDTTSLDVLLTDLNTQISNAKVEYQTVITQAETLNFGSYTGVGSFTALRTDIVTGQNDLKVALSDAKKIIEGLKNLQKSTKPTIIPTVTP